MRLALLPHPDTPSDAVSGIEVEVERRGAELLLSYSVTGVLDRLIIPPPASPERTDGLWQHTCVEAFIRPDTTERYWEFNFSPSSQWAAYRFDTYRSGMRNADEPAPPSIETHSTESFDVHVSLSSGLPPACTWKVGLSAVIEEVGGRKSYWALAHAAGRPDFHSPDCFALELAPPAFP